MIAEELDATIDLLRRCQMPPAEIDWLVAADDPAVVHMIVELHGERLAEELAERRKALADVEARLTERTAARGSLSAA